MSNASYAPKQEQPYTVNKVTTKIAAVSDNSRTQCSQKNISQYAEIEQIYANTLGAGFQTLSVLSPDPKTGTTSIVCALAQRHANTGRSVLVVDVNLKTAALDDRFNLTRNDWPRDIALLTEELPSLIQPVQPGMSVLTAPLNSAQALKSQKYLESLISFCQKQFDVIIFDTSPLNAINQHNVPAETLATLTQASIIILKGAETTEAAVRQAHAKLALANSKVNLVGAVINDQSNPRLADELIRETSRLDKRFPGLTSKIRRWITHNHFLNTAI